MKRKLLILALILVVLVPLGVYGLWPLEQDTSSTLTRTYTIDVPLHETYTKLAPPDTVRKIVVLGNSTFLGEESEDPGPLGLGFGGLRGIADSMLTQHALERHTILKVETDDAYIGKQIIELQQDSSISLSGITSTTRLLEPKGRLRAYDLTSRIEGSESTTVIESTLTMTILTTAPRFFRWVARRRVKAATELRLELLEKAFRDVIEGSEPAGDTPPPAGDSPETGPAEPEPRENESQESQRHGQAPLTDWRKLPFAA